MEPKVGDWLLLKDDEPQYIKDIIPRLTKILSIYSKSAIDGHFVNVAVKKGQHKRDGINRSMQRFIHLGANLTKLEKAFYGL